VIGVQMIGFHAGDLIHEWVPVINGRVPPSAVTDAIHVYPTFAEINKSVGLAYLVSRIPPWTKRLTKFLFRYRGEAS
jgi:hypothetical protein